MSFCCLLPSLLHSLGNKKQNNTLERIYHVYSSQHYSICNTISHWLGAYRGWSLLRLMRCHWLCNPWQCSRKTFMVHQTIVRWASYILLKFMKSLIGHLTLAVGNVRRFSWTLPWWVKIRAARTMGVYFTLCQQSSVCETTSAHQLLSTLVTRAWH